MKLFIEGLNEGKSGGAGNLYIQNDFLIHFQTTIAQRHKKKFIINMTRYSVVTGKVQKYLKEQLTEDQQIIVTMVPRNTKI